MIFKGKVVDILDIKEGTTQKGETYKTRDIRILEETEGKYPNEIIVNLFKQGDYVKYVEDEGLGFVVGDSVECEYSTRVNEYNGKFYGSNNAFKIISYGQWDSHGHNAVAEAIQDELPGSDDDTLPF